MWHWYVLFFFSLHVAQIRLLISVADAMQLKMSCSSFVLCTRTYKVCNVAAYLRIQLTRILRYLFAVYFCFSIYTWEEFATLFEPNERNVKNLFKKHIQLTSVWASLSLSLSLLFSPYGSIFMMPLTRNTRPCPVSSVRVGGLTLELQTAKERKIIRFQKI